MAKKPMQSVCNLINDGKIAKHAVIGLTDNRGIFSLMQDSDDTRYYAFSDEADVLAMQEQRIAELVQENERLQKHIDKLDKARERDRRNYDEQYARLGRAALDISAELPAKKQKQAYSRLAVLGVRYG